MAERGDMRDMASHCRLRRWKGPEVGARGRGPRTVGSLWKLGKARKPPPLKPPAGMQPCQHLEFCPVRPVWTSDLQNCKIINLGFVCCCYIN